MERVPVQIRSAFVEALHGPLHLHQVYLAIASQVHELCLPAGQGCGRLARDQFNRTELWRKVFLSFVIDMMGWTQVPFVKPSICLLGENAGDAFSVQIHPLITRSVHSIGEVLKALWVDIPDGFLNDRLAVFEFQGWQGFFQVDSALALISG